jgi:Fur family ferric uptake transcriptional regulator
MSDGSEIRLTKQRQVILEELDRNRCHPSADEVFALVRERLPRISLGTVYRNLELLAERGLVRRLGAAGEKRRYDVDRSEHSHVWCRTCGRVDDVPGRAVVSIEGGPAVAGYEIYGYRVEFEGRCPGCRRAVAEGPGPGG